jgi:hypothetical protein
MMVRKNQRWLGVSTSVLRWYCKGFARVPALLSGGTATPYQQQNKDLAVPAQLLCSRTIKHRFCDISATEIIKNKV